MSDSFEFLDEPLLTFGEDQEAEDPRDGLALFGPFEQKGTLPDHVAIGTPRGLDLWSRWVDALNSPASCVELSRQRPWPPFPGYDVAFGTRWPAQSKSYPLDIEDLSNAARKADRYERAYEVANLYLSPFEQIRCLDAKPAIAVCIVPDEVYRNCRPKSFVSETSDEPRSKAQREFPKDRHSGPPFRPTAIVCRLRGLGSPRFQTVRSLTGLSTTAQGAGHGR